jgi:hypothetical protein
MNSRARATGEWDILDFLPVGDDFILWLTSSNNNLPRKLFRTFFTQYSSHTPAPRGAGQSVWVLFFPVVQTLLVPYPFSVHGDINRGYATIA